MPACPAWRRSSNSTPEEPQVKPPTTNQDMVATVIATGRDWREANDHALAAAAQADLAVIARRRSTASSAWSKSAMRSSGSSTPIEIRTRLSVIPSACLRSSGHRQMGHRGRGAGECLGAAEADREMGDLQGVEEGEGLLLAALQIEREGRAGAGAVAAVDVGLAGVAALLEEAEIADALDLGMVAQEAAHLVRILAGPDHSQLERLEAPQEHPGRIGIGDRADRVAEHPDGVDQLLRAGDPAGDEIGMAAGIFGQRIDREVGALAERLRPERAEEGVVDRDRRPFVAEHGEPAPRRRPRRRPGRWSGWPGSRDR